MVPEPPSPNPESFLDPQETVQQVNGWEQPRLTLMPPHPLFPSTEEGLQKPPLCFHEGPGSLVGEMRQELVKQLGPIWAVETTAIIGFRRRRCRPELCEECGLL